jgi:hypothetical protein
MTGKLRNLSLAAAGALVLLLAGTAFHEVELVK